MKLLAKMTVKTMDAQPKPMTVEVSTDLVSMYGMIRGKEMGQSNFGDFVKFKGEFEGVHLGTGEVYRSSVLILPKTLEEMLSNSVPDSDGAVQFGVIIGVQPSDKGSTGYAFTMKPMIEPEVSDELAKLRGMAKTHVQENALEYKAPNNEPKAEVAEAPKAKGKKIDTAKDE